MPVDASCPVCRTADVVCSKWTLLLVRELAEGCSRFSELERSLAGISPRTLSLRLRALEDEGVVERCTAGDRAEYRLTDKGRDLWPNVVALMSWGDRHLSQPDGPPVELVHTECGHAMLPTEVCSHCGEPVHARNVRPRPGPGLVAGRAA